MPVQRKFVFDYERVARRGKGGSSRMRATATTAKLHRFRQLIMESYAEQPPYWSMKPVPEYHQITSDLFVWHGYNPECKTDCSSTAIRTPEGFVLIDPVRLEEQAIERMVGDDKVGAVLLTNGNHLRGSLYEKERLDIPIYAPEGAQQEVPADYLVKDGELLFETVKTIALPGGGSGETAYLAPEVLVIGDALTNLDGLQILPDKYCQNLTLLLESLRVLRSLNFDIVCFAHGLPIVGSASQRVSEVV